MHGKAWGVVYLNGNEMQAAKELMIDGACFREIILILQQWAIKHQFIFIEDTQRNVWLFQDRADGHKGELLPQQPTMLDAITFILQECERRSATKTEEATRE